MFAAERHSEHAQGYEYERHRPEETVLHRVVSTYWPEFRERVEALGSLPKFVVRDVDEYLRCGILEHGFIRVQCTDCGFERLVAFSCKRRGFCPSCGVWGVERRRRLEAPNVKPGSSDERYGGLVD